MLSDIKNSQHGESPNFEFLRDHDPLLVRYTAQAETYVFSDPNTALIKLRQFAELLAKQVGARIGSYSPDEEFLSLIRRLEDRRILTREVANLFHAVRKAGNDAVHNHAGTRREALQQLKFARQLGVWFHRVFGT